jgi:hypothetical protein
MVSSVSEGGQFNLHAVLDQAMQNGVLTRRDHLALTAAMLSNPSLSSAERMLINRLFDFIRMGRVRIED